MNTIVVNGILTKGDTVRGYDVKYNEKQVYTLAVTRRSGTIDTLLVLSDEELQEGLVMVEGHLHAEYIHHIGHVPVVIIADHVKSDEDNGYCMIELIGPLKKKPTLRSTNSGLAIASGILNTDDGPIPVLFWGSNATNAEQVLDADDRIKVIGRLQSRKYPDRKKNWHTTYELSTSGKFELLSVSTK